MFCLEAVAGSYSAARLVVAQCAVVRLACVCGSVINLAGAGVDSEFRANILKIRDFLYSFSTALAWARFLPVVVTGGSQ